MSLSYRDFIEKQSIDQKAFVDPDIGRFMDESNVKTLFTDDDYVKTLLGHFPFAYYLLNYRTQKFEFIHNSRILGYSDTDFLSGGLQDSLKNIHPDDFAVISDKLFPFIWDFVTTLPDNQSNYRFSINFRYMRKDKSYMHLQQHLTFLDFDHNKLPVRNLSVIYDISSIKTDTSINLIITKLDEDKESIVLQEKYFHESLSELSEREKEMNLDIRNRSGI